MTAPTFTAETYSNPYLPAGAGTMDAVVTITAPPASEVPMTQRNPRSEFIIIDVSGSMSSGRKMRSAIEAAKAAVNCIDDGTTFTVIAGNDGAWTVFGPAPATEASRSRAAGEIQSLRADGGTAIGSWLHEMVRHLGDDGGAGAHAILLTDGQNEHDRPGAIASAIDALRGRVQVDCRGVGTDWVVDELRTISSALLGTVDIVANPSQLAEDFEAMMQSSMARAIPDVTLRLWTPAGAEIPIASQVAPEIQDLDGVAVSPQEMEFLLGGWAPGESRDYHLQIRFTPGGIGDEMLAGRVTVVDSAGNKVGAAMIKAVWTEDTELSTRINKHVAHYTGQAELASAIQEGIAAAKSGDTKTATIRLGRAAQLASESGNTDTIRLLSGVVDIDDARSGTVRLKKATKEAEMQLDTRSTRTVRLGK